MLFNSYSFLFAFLPCVLLLVKWARANGRHQQIVYTLLLSSLLFYAAWDPVYVFLPLASLIFNFCLAKPIARYQRRWCVALGVASNLLLLGYFKYYTFFLSNLAYGLGWDIPVPTIVLPLAISFFTFQQIAYLVDVYRDPHCRIDSFVYYATFVIFFPHFIAGPIVHHKCLVPQLKQPTLGAFTPEDLGIGITLFAVGLFKKVCFADALLMPYARLVFDAAGNHIQVNFMDAWLGALCYTFQIYFDFSGYSDMACGLARLFGVRFPINFNSPYQATSVVSFWRRWHMTLSEFLKNYLYIPLGGNRVAPLHQSFNLMLVMLLGGLWHGAQWTFVIWGGLHGLYLMVNHAWRKYKNYLGPQGWDTGYVCRFVYHQLTFVSVVLAWIFFRADTFQAAWSLLKAALFLGPNKALPDSFQSYASFLSYFWPTQLVFDNYAFMIKTKGLVLKNLLLVASIAFCIPNIYALLAQVEADYAPLGSSSRRWWHFSFGRCWALVIGVVLFVAVFSINFESSEFLYFQF